MVPILWRYLLQSYLRILLLSVGTFLAVLLVTRFKEIARFTALSGDFGKTAWFTSYQFPLILPIAIPISALLAAYLTFQRLSRTHEFMAMRAAGVSLSSLAAPLLFASALFFVGHFSICAEIAPYCRRESKEMLFRETSGNPLLLLQRQNLVKLKHAYLDMKVKEEGKIARHFNMIAYNESNKRLSLIQAKELSIEGDQLVGRDMAIVSHLDETAEEAFDPLIIENQASMSTAAPILSEFLKKNHPRFDTNALSLRMLILRCEIERKKAAAGALVEILRRLSMSLAVFSFTFLGCAFGFESGRTPSRRNLFWAFALTLTVFVSYLTGKELKSFPYLATCAFLLPHPFIWFVSWAKFNRIAKGIAR